MSRPPMDMDALQHISNGPTPDLMLVDWNMPGMSAWTSLRRSVPAECSNYQDPMVTMRPNQYSMQELLQSGADEYLMKPFYERSRRPAALGFKV